MVSPPFAFVLSNGGAAEDGVAVIEDNGLPRGDGANGGIEFHPHLAA